MNSKWHFRISLVKSCIRIFGCLSAIGLFNKEPAWAIALLASLFFLAEILGILEESWRNI